VGATGAPEGSELLGVYYPRAGTLGGCSTHNVSFVDLL
jgi:choline dehydrogenase